MIGAVRHAPTVRAPHAAGGRSAASCPSDCGVSWRHACKRGKRPSPGTTVWA